MQSTGISAIWTPPRTKAKASKKDKKKLKKSKEPSSELSQLEIEWKNVRRCHSASPTDDRRVSPLTARKTPLKVSLSCEATSSRRVNGGREMSPLTAGSSNKKERIGDHPAADVRLRPPKDEPDGLTSDNRDKRKSFFHELQRSHSLDMLSDEYEFHRSKTQELPKV